MTRENLDEHHRKVVPSLNSCAVDGWAGAGSKPDTGRLLRAPGPTVVVHPTEGQLKRNEQGDYYVGDKPILNNRRSEALKKCTHNQAFESDRYVACMAREGQAP